MIKRLFDIVVSILALIILSPIIIFCTLLIVLTDGFPIVFKQSRAGLNGKMFDIYKFRSMTNDKNASATGDLGNTKRITWAGNILRKTKLDELLQFWNVLKGDMSIVGPRPELSFWLDCYNNRWKKVHRVRPGITDNASIVYRDEEEILAKSDDPVSTYRDEILPNKMDMYEYYVDNHNLKYDITIIIRTVLAIAGKKYTKEEINRV